jgi:hypothetical protein
VRGNKFIGEDIVSEPVEIIKSEDVKMGSQTFNSKKMTGKNLE